MGLKCLAEGFGIVVGGVGAFAGLAIGLVAMLDGLDHGETWAKVLGISLLSALLLGLSGAVGASLCH